jgi:hypothetical protein
MVLLYTNQEIRKHSKHLLVIFCKPFLTSFTTEVQTNEAKLLELKITQAPVATLGIAGKDMSLFCSAAKPEGFTGSITFTWEKDGKVNVPSSSQVI